MSQFNFSCKHCGELITIESFPSFGIECKNCHYKYSNSEVQETSDNFHTNEFGAEIDNVYNYDLE